jgi:hypothetical protein
MSYDESIAFDPDALINLPSGRAWLGWHVAAVPRENIPAGSFTLRSGNTREIIDLSAGFCFDWPTSLIGWMHTEGVRGEPPRRIWSETRSKLPPRPAPINGRPWKHAFWSQACLFIGTEPVRVIWESGQEASWKAYRDLMIQLAAGAPKRLPKLPLIAFTETSPVMVPMFEVASYIDRPTCLPTEPEDSQSQGNGTLPAAYPWEADDPGPQAPPY